MREEVWLERISHIVGFCLTQPDGCFRLSSLYWEGESFFLAIGGLGRGAWVSVQPCPAGEQGGPCHSVWVEENAPGEEMCMPTSTHA